MMVDVVLLTDSGKIVFCFIPHNTLEQFREMTLEAEGNEVVWALIETENGTKHEVRCENILVKYGGVLHG